MEYYPAKKKEWNLAICSNMDGLGGHYAKSEISQRKINTVWDSLYVKSKNYNKLVNATKKKGRRTDIETKLVATNGDGSVQFSHSVVSNSLWPHTLQHTRLPYPTSPTPEAYSNHVHWVGDAIQPSYPLSSLAPPAFNFPSISVFPRVGSLHQVAKELEFQPQHQSLQWRFRTDFL